MASFKSGDASKSSGTAAPRVNVSQHSDEDDAAQVKQKKAKKPNLTVAEAAAKIYSARLTTFLAENPDLPMVRFADFFERAFSAVSVAEFSWVELFREHLSACMTETPVSHISSRVYRASIHWISEQTTETLSSFVRWCLERIFEDLESQQSQDESSKSLVGIFVALAMVLRQRPCALINGIATDYHGDDMLNVVSWMIAQASREDLAVGLYSWARFLLPIWNENSSNPHFTENMLEIVESILYLPNAWSILESGTFGNGERLIPPLALEMLLRSAFPPSSAEVEDTRRLQKIYSELVYVALAGSKAMEGEARQILSFAIKAAGENNDLLSSGAAYICAWCLTQDSECYKLWDTTYIRNPKANIAILKYISEHWMDLRVKLAPLDPLRETLKNFRQKNEAAIARRKRVALFKEADKYCKVVLRKSACNWFLIEMVCFVAVLAVVVALFINLTSSRHLITPS